MAGMASRQEWKGYMIKLPVLQENVHVTGLRIWSEAGLNNGRPPVRTCRVRYTKKAGCVLLPPSQRDQLILFPGRVVQEGARCIRRRLGGCRARPSYSCGGLYHFVKHLGLLKNAYAAGADSAR